MNREYLKTLIDKTGSRLFFFRKKDIDAKEINRVLVSMLYFRGDVLMCTPAFRTLRKILPEAEIDIWVKSRSCELLSGNPHINRTIVFDGIRSADYGESNDHSFAEKISFIRSLRENSYDLFIDLTGKYSTALLSIAGGFRYSAGLNYNGFGFCYSRHARVDTQNTAGHLSRKYGEVVKQTFELSEKDWGELGGNDIQPEFHLREDELTSAEDMLRSAGLGLNLPVVCIQPSAGWKAKELEGEKYSMLIKLLHGFADIIIIGGVHDRKEVLKIANDSGIGDERVFTGTDIRQSAALISRSAVFVGSDSVGLQIASALCIPSVAIFGPTNPGFSNPSGKMHKVIYRKLECSASEEYQYCSRNAGKTCKTIDCMKSVTPEEIRDSVCVLLQEQTKENEDIAHK